MSRNLDRIGDLLIVGFDGLDAPPDILERIKSGRVGGIILFSRNIRDADQVRQLCATLQHARSEAADTPLVIAIDQEGGTVARLRDPWPQIPGNMALGAADSDELAYQAGQWLAGVLRPLGITLNLAPVLDLASTPQNPGIGVRSFGADPARVGALGLAIIRGMQDAGLAATAKHFPGMGDAVLDAHKALPVVTTSWSDLQRFHMAPFRAAMDGGVAAVMTAHCAYPSLDRMTRLPATLNRRLWQQVVRREFGYEGAVISDCLEMQAFTKWCAPEAGAMNAVMAGVDLLLVCHTRSIQDAVFDSLRGAVQRGLIAEVVLCEALARADTVRCFSEGRGVADSAEPLLGDRIAQQAVTIVRGAALPLRIGRIAVFVPPAFLQTEVEAETPATFEPLVSALHEAGCATTLVPLTPDASPPTCDAAVLVTANAHLYDGQRAAAAALLERLDVPAVVAAVRNPFDAPCFPESTVILTYSDTPPALRALAKVLLGQVDAPGHVPVVLGLGR